MARALKKGAACTPVSRRQSSISAIAILKSNALQYSLFDEAELAPSAPETPIELYRRLARERGGECLSPEYKGSKVALRFRCREGHEWNARPADIKNKPTKDGRGTWCPFCSKRRVEGVADFQKIAEKHGGVCLSTEYKNSKTRLRFRCSKGHEWETQANAFKQGHWCRRCAAQTKADEKRLTITEFQLIAASRGGTCLSLTYLDNATKLLFRCSEGHEWEAFPSNIKRGAWCSRCATEGRKLGLADIQETARERGGACLSTEYENSRKKLLFRCAEGHEWEAAAAAVRHGSWCPTCGYKKNTDGLRGSLEEFQAIAAAHGGVCLSTHYENTSQTLRFRCSVGHEFDAHASSIKYRGHWCSYCRGTRHEDIFGFVQNFARSRGGECLTKEFRGTKYKLHFRCSEGHEWEVRPHTIRRGWGWCRVCFDKAKFERIVEIAKANGGECLSDFAAYQSHKRPHKSPLLFRCIDGHEWHSNANQVASGYWCPECTNKSEGLVRQFLECVFGVKLPSKSPAWINSPEFHRCVLDGYNEQIKLAFEYHGEQHFEHIEYFHEGDGKRTLQAQQARDAYVRARCAAHGVRLIEIPSLPQKCGRDEFVALVRPLVEQATETAITSELIDRFDALPYQPSKIKQLADIAAARGGLCLSVKYLGVASSLQWRCAEGHEWEAAPSAIRTGQWCPFCAGVRIIDPMGEIQALAHSRGGRCLSTEYLGATRKHQFECAKGHRFDTTPKSMKAQGAWCLTCSYQERGLKRRKPVDDIKDMAAQRGGQLLEVRYANWKALVTLRCQCGHEWETDAAGVRQGRWCPHCAAVAKGKKAAEARQRKKNLTG